MSRRLTLCSLQVSLRPANILCGSAATGSRKYSVFDDLVRILDSEIGLITPTDPEGKDEGGRMSDEVKTNPTASDSSIIAHPSSTRYFQLTHDYLVHSLRDWLTRKQKETRRGRAELLLADRASVWNTRQENRQLPSLTQWAGIRLLTQTKNWTKSQRTMMRKATWYHTLRDLTLATIFALTGWGGYEGFAALTARHLRDRLLDASTQDVPNVVRDMSTYRRWINPLLSAAFKEAASNGDVRKQLHASLALLPIDDGQVGFLFDQLLAAEPQEVIVLRDALSGHKVELLDKLWSELNRPAGGWGSQRLRAASALASYDADSPLWANANEPIANDLVGVQSVYLAIWLDALRPVRAKLQAPLEAIFRDPKRRETLRSLATDVLAEYAAEQPQVLAKLLLDANDVQFVVLYPKLKSHGEPGINLLQDAINKRLPPDAEEDSKEQFGKQQANAAVALLRMDRPERVWLMLKHSPDPRARSYLIHRLGALGADAKTIIQRLHVEPDVTIRRALVLSVGEFSEDAVSLAERERLVKLLHELYQSEDDSGLHGAAEWLLRHRRQNRWLQEKNAAWAEDQRQREQKLALIQSKLSKEKSPQWYVNCQGQTMVVIPGPVEFTMGSPPTEVGRDAAEWQHKMRIGRTFALSAQMVTLEQCHRKFPVKHQLLKAMPEPSCAMLGLVWFGERRRSTATGSANKKESPRINGATNTIRNRG